MTPEFFLEHAIFPAYDLLPENFGAPEASAMILAIGLQESRFEHRRQIGGPARGYTQFEMGGGIIGVLKHEATRDLIRGVLKNLDYTDDSPLASYQAIEHNDVLCAAYSRLLLWSHRDPLPRQEEREIAWQYYLDLWRPGKPHRKTWDAFYDDAWRIIDA